MDVQCTIERRLLVNYRVEPEVVAALLPPPLRPQLVAGWAVGGVCFIRLRHLRPSGVPACLGFTNENVAHRFAAEWQDGSGKQVGVYVPRRDTTSRTVSWSGGRLFPGAHHLAHFDVQDDGRHLKISTRSEDGDVRLSVKAELSRDIGGQLFSSLHEATEFFRQGIVGYSPGTASGCLEGVRLHCERWTAEPVSVAEMSSSMFDDTALFPAGTCALDSAIVMRDLPARWSPHGLLRSNFVGTARPPGQSDGRTGPLQEHLSGYLWRS